MVEQYNLQINIAKTAGDSKMIKDLESRLEKAMRRKYFEPSQYLPEQLKILQTEILPRHTNRAIAVKKYLDNNHLAENKIVELQKKAGFIGVRIVHPDGIALSKVEEGVFFVRPPSK